MPKPPSQMAAKYTEPDFEKIVAKPVSPLQEHFHEWVLEKTGYDPATAKTKAAAFYEGIRLGTALRGIHQASPENQERLAQAAAERLAEEAAAEPKPAKVAKAAKAAPEAAAPAKKTTAKKAAPAAPEATVPPRKRAPAKKTTGRAVVVEETNDDEAPF